MLFATYLTHTQKPQSIKLYLSTVCTLHIEHGLPDPTSEVVNLRRLMRGIKRVHGNTIDSWIPITPSLLRSFRSFLNLSYPDHLTLWAAIQLAFFAFLRSGELLSLHCLGQHLTNNLYPSLYMPMAFQGQPLLLSRVALRLSPGTRHTPSSSPEWNPDCHPERDAFSPPTLGTWPAFGIPLAPSSATQTGTWSRDAINTVPSAAILDGTWSVTELPLTVVEFGQTSRIGSPNIDCYHVNDCFNHMFLSALHCVLCFFFPSMYCFFPSLYSSFILFYVPVSHVF